MAGVELQVMVRHAGLNFHLPHWSEEYRLVKLEPTLLEMVNEGNSRDDTTYHHLSTFNIVFG